MLLASIVPSGTEGRKNTVRNRILVFKRVCSIYRADSSSHAGLSINKYLSPIDRECHGRKVPSTLRAQYLNFSKAPILLSPAALLASNCHGQSVEAAAR